MAPTTRRQSGKLPPPRNPVSFASHEDEDDFMDGALSDLDEPLQTATTREAAVRKAVKADDPQGSEDFEDEEEKEEGIKYDEEYNASGKRPTKRRKVEPSKAKVTRQTKTPTTSASASAKTKPAGAKANSGKLRGNRGKLRDMLSMPLDIFYEVCKLLSPADLLSLARTSKGLREILMSRSSITVWKSARQSLGDLVPLELPREFSEPAWAALVFVRACTGCDTKNAQIVDWAFKRRLCTSCRKHNLFYEGKLKSTYPDADPAVLELLPYTHTGAWAHGLASGKRYFWHDELRVLVMQRGKLLKNFMMGKTGAKAALTEFDTVKLKAVKSLMKSCDVLETWYDEFDRNRAAQSTDAKTARYEAIVNRLLALGYERRDMSCWTFKNLSAVNSSKPLTDRGWNTIRPGLEKYCTKERDDRWESERRHAREERTRKAKCLYAEYRRTILPSEWFYLPTPEQATKLPWCAEIIERDFKTTLVESDFDVPLTNLASSVEAWVREKRDHCIAMLPEEYRGAMPSSAPMIPTSLTSPSVSDVRQGRSRGNLCPFLGPLELARAVFRVPNGTNLLVAKEACHTWKEEALSIEFSACGSEAAVQMMTLAGLDPKSTTAADLDAKDHRFLCLNCYRANRESWGSIKAETWRSAVEHQFTAPETTHVVPAWQLVQPTEAVSIRMRERLLSSAPHASHNHWHCQHCGPRQESYHYMWRNDPLNAKEYIDVSWNRQGAISHVQATHNIPNPSDADVVYIPPPGCPDPGKPIVTYIIGASPPPTVSAKTKKGQNFACKHCQPSKNPRLFVERGVMDHIKAVHKVTDPKIAVDFEIHVQPNT
ncbi:uncharacterized protein STEHIDRAFT_171802 [Stereum hirsutum FP-91666 SS1]|uniref:uncharacterized protein n=1 Tax=Stereum hirsutum (strain FP-91666) TaxID=721885 RepID=UPI0004449619|nr:uncharacterized protein STEHIDRAFT_171802 [Stereum hirsutum FP-91666 SS1]EIM81424.1 hypothetical protein STEHIDRAFT_171802 [Stereum hirsutum FP-91666 SS1]